jgi:hypothetical protein
MPLVLDMSYVAKYYLSMKAFSASSHMVIIILAVVMGDKLNINYNKNLSTKHKWSYIILSIIQKSFDRRYFNHSNNIIVKQLF